MRTTEVVSIARSAGTGVNNVVGRPGVPVIREQLHGVLAEAKLRAAMFDPSRGAEIWMQTRCVCKADPATFSQSVIAHVDVVVL